MPGSAAWIRLALVIAACGALLLLSGPASRAQPEEPTDSDIIPGRYIVMLKGPGSPRAVTARAGVRARVNFEHGIWGFAGEFSDQALRRLRADPAVLSIEPDRIVTADDQTLPTGIDRADVDLSTVAMIDGVDDALDVDIAIIDTGIQPDHPDLRVVGGASFVGDDCAGDSWADDNGHGTHVAGTAAAIDNSIGVVGVAPGARLWAVKVLNAGGSGYFSCIIAGVDWVTANAATIEAANMSLGGSDAPSVCNAIAGSAAAGVVYSVAAGNSSDDASSFSPANCADVLTTSAIADFDGVPGGLHPQNYGLWCMAGDDIFACFSNYGPPVEIAAPGVDIYSTYKGSSYRTMSGTSMAAPHVAGAAALDIVEHGKPTDAAGAAAVRARVVATAAPQDGSLGFTGDPDSYHEPLLFLRSRGAGDAAVGLVTAPDLIATGDVVPVDVTVWHDSTSSHTLTLTLAASGGSVLNSPQVLTLGPDSFATPSFTWDTTGLSPGDYTLTATVQLGGDTFPDNDSRSVVVTVRLPHDVAVTDLEVASTVGEGDQLWVQPRVTNLGTFSETFSLALTASSGAVSGSPQTLTLEPGSSAAPQFTWDTTGLPPGDYTLTATAHLEGDANPDNDSRSVTVRHDVAIAQLHVEPRFAEDSPAPVWVTATNLGTFSETFSVSLAASGGTIEGSPQEMALAPGGSATLFFTWHTPEARPEPYTLTAEAEPVPGEVSTSNNSVAAEVFVVVPWVHVVNSTADPGSGRCDANECTLREAIIFANGTSPQQLVRIEFNIPPGGPQTIAPLSPLPDIYHAVTIDGTTQPGYAGSPIIELSGAAMVTEGDGLRFTSYGGGSAGSTVRGLVINRFDRSNSYGLELANAGGNVIQGNFIGTDITGAVALGNRNAGIHVSGSDNNIIGGTAPGTGNVISGNVFRGIEVSDGSSGTIIQGNLIGTEITGAVALGNAINGVEVSNSANTSIGGTAAGAGNVIAGGIRANGSSGTIVEGNFIGTDKTGAVALGNSGDGVYVAGSADTTIGGTAPGAGNVISGNGDYGIVIKTSSTSVIEGNIIGMDVTGAIPLGNGSTGVDVRHSVNTRIGGTAAGARNVISANDRGIYIGDSYSGRSLGTIIQGNFIGTDITGGVVRGNRHEGIELQGSPTTIIGGTAPEAGNVISANEWNGIVIDTEAYNPGGPAVQGNWIGTDRTGVIPLGNGFSGIAIAGGGVMVGGTAVGAGNTIAYNNHNGVTGYVNQGNTIRGNSIHSNGRRGIHFDYTELAPPIISSVVGPVMGRTNPRCYPCTVEVFSDDGGQGRIFHGSTTTNDDADGTWTYVGEVTGPHITATITDAAGTTSDFSVPVVYPPLSPAVGGIAVLPDAASGSGWSAGTYAAVAALASGAAAVLSALAAGAWYARRRSHR